MIPSLLAVVLALGAGPAPTDTLTVFAASDLQLAFHEIAAGFEQRTGTRVVLVFGSSGALATQIEHGAPADLFFSADQTYVAALIGRGVLYRGSDRRYARGVLLLATRAGYGRLVTTPADLRRAEVVRVAIANPDHAPYGRAAREALVALGLWAELQPKVVLGENVRQVAQFLASGAVEAAFLPPSLLRDGALVGTAVDTTLYRPIVQSAGIVKASPRAARAREFLDYVVGPEGWPLMARYGFLRADGH